MAKTKLNSASPLVYILQWLTYAFWGWLALSLAWLSYYTLNFFVHGASTANDMYAYANGSTTGVAYPLAAVLVLWFAAMLCDWFYSKLEPREKHGVSLLIMVVHAVLFALAAIAAFILTVFAGLQMFIGSTTTEDTALTSVFAGGITSIVLALSLVRVLRNWKFSMLPKFYWVIMTFIATGIIGFAVAGPAMHAHNTRDDRLIESSLGNVSNAINDYALKQDKLPASLNDIQSQLIGDARLLIQRNLVEYVPSKKVSTPSDQASIETNTAKMLPVEVPKSIRYYQLCVTYKEKRQMTYGAVEPAIAKDTSVASTYPETFTHEKGRVCYDLATGSDYKLY